MNLLNNMVNPKYGVDEYGECIPIDDIKSIVRKEVLEELEEQKRKSNKQKEAHKKIKSKEEFKVLIDKTLGSFFFSHFIEVLNIFNDEKGNFDGALAFRFIYLCTFIDYDNKLRWGNNFRGKHRTEMLENDLKEVLGLSRNQIAKDKQKLVDLGVLKINKDKTINIDFNYCHKGIYKHNLKGESIRVFENGIQKLYKASIPKEHKRLGLFIKLIPYLNKENNILCLNPQEEKLIGILPLSIQDICKITGYAVNNARRLESELLKITVGNEYLMMKHMKYYLVIYSINPRIFYSGSNLENLQSLIDLFYMER
ncbi:hypothetical protein [Clostridium butyricum]|uniref:hypothetical protein n=1 Tax=Clostridium butyricum TaxID=1492 RepID=UPI003D32FE29